MAPGGIELERERHAGTMWPTCKVRVTSCFQRSVMCKRSPPCGFRAFQVTRDAERSHVKLIAHQMREKLQEEWENGKKVCRALPRSPDTSTWGLSLPLNHTILDKRVGGEGPGGGGCWYRFVHSGCSCCWQSPDREILEKPAFERCLHGTSQPATCFSFFYVFFISGLWATSQLSYLPSQAIQHGWPACTHHTQHTLILPQRFIIPQCHS